MTLTPPKKLDRWALLGASRGLGKSIALELRNNASGLILVSRKTDLLNSLAKELCSAIGNVRTFTLDFSNLGHENIQALTDSLEAFQPEHIVYCAGGGPFGAFTSKSWKDHEWALNVSLLFPMKAFHALLSENHLKSLKQIIFVGSSVAERKPDPMALSYCVAKHGMRGFVETLQRENNSLDVRLFSPGYMNTELLPPGALARRSGQMEILEPAHVAREFVEWSHDARFRSKNKTY